MVIRCTTKLQSLLRIKPSDFQSFDPADDDWYANLVWIDRRKRVLLSHAATLFSIFVADVLKQDLIPFGRWAVEPIRDELAVEGVGRQKGIELMPPSRRRDDVRLGSVD